MKSIKSQAPSLQPFCSISQVRMYVTEGAEVAYMEHTQNCRAAALENSIPMDQAVTRCEAEARNVSAVAMGLLPTDQASNSTQRRQTQSNGKSKGSTMSSADFAKVNDEH